MAWKQLKTLACYIFMEQEALSHLIWQGPRPKPAPSRDSQQEHWVHCRATTLEQGPSGSRQSTQTQTPILPGSSIYPALLCRRLKQSQMS